MNRLLYCFACVVLASWPAFPISGLSYSNPFTTLPAGEYKIYVKNIFNCDNTTEENKINLYLKSYGNTIKGNGTLKIPLDDTIYMELAFSIRDPINGWKDNAYMQKSPKACTTLKNLIGGNWPNFVNDTEITSVNCPIAAGIYHVKNLEISKYKNTNFSKTFIYGTYKIRLQFTRRNAILGCTYIVVELKRP